MNKRVTLISIAIVALVAIPVALWIRTSISQQGTVQVAILTVPEDATVVVKDVSYTGKKSFRIAPGVYEVKTSKEGFSETTQTITVSEDTKTTVIAALNPESIEAQQWAQRNQLKYTRLEGQAGQLANEKGRAFNEEYPITKKLPLQKATYRLGYRQVSEKASDGIIVTISAYQGYREAALQELRDLGFDPSDYTIEFTNYRNPFNE